MPFRNVSAQLILLQRHSPGDRTRSRAPGASARVTTDHDAGVPHARALPPCSPIGGCHVTSHLPLPRSTLPHIGPAPRECPGVGECTSEHPPRYRHACGGCRPDRSRQNPRHGCERLMRGWRRKPARALDRRGYPGYRVLAVRPAEPKVTHSNRLGHTILRWMHAYFAKTSKEETPGVDFHPCVWCAELETGHES